MPKPRNSGRRGDRIPVAIPASCEAALVRRWNRAIGLVRQPDCGSLERVTTSSLPTSPAFCSKSASSWPSGIRFNVEASSQRSVRRLDVERRRAGASLASHAPLLHPDRAPDFGLARQPRSGSETVPRRTMECNVKAGSARCTYTATMTYSGKDPYVITQTATQERLQVSVVPGAGQWKLLVAAFISRGTQTITANGKSLSGGDAAVQVTNWEVPIAVPRNPNNLSGRWTNSLGDTIRWNLSR
jgi:hypothetical protein